MQDDVNANLLFAGLEFGVYFTRRRRLALDAARRAAFPPHKRAISSIQRRENDLVVGTFGRGAFILDDYTALREVTPQALSEEAHLFPLRDAYMFDILDQAEATWGDPTTPNPPYGAVFTYSVGQPPAGDAKLVLTIADDTGKQVRRLDLVERARRASHRLGPARRRAAPHAGARWRRVTPAVIRPRPHSFSADAGARAGRRSGGTVSRDDRKADWGYGHADRSAATRLSFE